MNSLLTFVHALSPLHAGTGQGIGVIDLPIAREKATNLPYLPGSSLKGTLRDECGDEGLRDRIFGPKVVDDQNSYASSANFTDQRLLCLPVRSLAGTFAWVTSPFILGRLRRDAADAGVEGLPASMPAPSDIGVCKTAPRAEIHLSGGGIVIEDLDLTAEGSEEAAAWAGWVAGQVFPGDAEWQEFFLRRLCVVHDDVMSFLSETATEVTARNKLAEGSKTVEKGGLWYEEALPAETILSGLLVAVKVKATDEQEVFSLVSGLVGAPLQLGGGATIGRGLCHVRLGAQAAAGGKGV